MTSIGLGSFSECQHLKDVRFPDTLISLGKAAFQNCSALNKIAIPTGILEINDYAFRGCMALAEVFLPTDLVAIRPYAFAYCIGITEIKIPEGFFVVIGGRAFYNCSNLLNIAVPDTTIAIGNGAFDGCTSLQAISIPTSVQSIGESAFAQCSSLKEVNYAGDAQQWDIISIGTDNEPLTSAVFHWNAPKSISYEISFDANGGIGRMDTQAVEKSSTVELNANGFTRDGYVFSGWNTSADGSGVSYADKASLSLTENLQLYAQWQKIEIKDNLGDIVIADNVASVTAVSSQIAKLYFAYYDKSGRFLYVEIRELTVGEKTI